MAKAKVIWRPGRNYKAKPEEAQEVFVKLKDTVGLTPQNVVDEAENPGSCLYDDFEWDDQIAGNQYRLIQARSMIRAVVKVKKGQKPQEGENVWIHTVDKDGEGAYETPQAVIKDPTLLSTAISEARQYLDSGIRRWSQLKQVSAGLEAARQAFDNVIENGK